MTKTKWQSLMLDFKFEQNEAEFNYISKMHNEPNRAYHNLNHVNDCLNKLAALGDIDNKTSIEIAFWFHDVIYDPFRKDNELKSAERAKAFLQSQSADASTITFVYDLIMATIHKEDPKNQSEAYMMDIDISILGSNPKSYKTYCANIRKEYKLVPSFLYNKKRIEIMEMFLNRKQLYYTPSFKEQYEVQARKNIQDEIVGLRG